jgi:hypothetical protein
MGLTVHDAKRAKSSLEEALASAADFLARNPEHSALAAQAKTMSSRLLATSIPGKEIDPLDPAAAAVLKEAVTLGQTVIASTDAGRKVPRLTNRIEDAARTIG